jgi:hypothetical protein
MEERREIEPGGMEARGELQALLLPLPLLLGTRGGKPSGCREVEDALFADVSAFAFDIPAFICCCVILGTPVLAQLGAAPTLFAVSSSRSRRARDSGERSERRRTEDKSGVFEADVEPLPDTRALISSDGGCDGIGVDCADDMSAILQLMNEILSNYRNSQIFTSNVEE